ncbi:MAG: radical SAM protein [Desulfobacteraceae bacterium]|nr:radical SAM protein [Desulfobacteraceae bacterium]
MKKVLFIQPPFFKFLGIYSRYFPYQFATMGAYLKNNGHLVKIVEGDKVGKNDKLDFSDQESLYGKYLINLKDYSDQFWNLLERIINEFRPDYIGITVWTTFLASSIHTAKFCKMIKPNALVVGGGPHVTLIPDDIIYCDAFDIAVIGEGEETFLEIVSDKPLNTISGIFYREDGVVKKNEYRPFEKKIDKFGTPDRTLLWNNNKYSDEDMGLLMTSRGCPFSCAYCATSIWKNKVRNRNIDYIIQEIERVNKQFGTIYFTIKDDSFLINKKRVFEFCKAIRRKKLDICWECNANLLSIDTDILKEIKSAGCIAIKVGVESGSDKIHRVINKKLNNKLIKEKIAIIKRSGIHLTCYFMMGIPGETKIDIMKTLKFAYQINPDFISFSVYEIFPGTKLHEVGIEDDTAIKRMHIEEFYKIEPHNYYFKNGNRQLKGMAITEFENLETYMKMKVSKFNRKPYKIWRRLLTRLPLYKTRSSYIFKDLKSFLNWV